jgi:CheY-like chemotaxis protein
LIWLIAEDEADILNLLTVMSQVWGHQTITFPTGQKAWDWLDTVELGTYTGTLPEFVLMDIRMPGKKGNEIARRMRTITAFHNVPITLMTAFSLDDAEKQALKDDDGVDAIIGKPLPDFLELQKILNGIIQSK